jgi:hypothetical protein
MRFGQLAILAAVPAASVLAASGAAAANTIVSCLGEQTTWSGDDTKITTADFWPELLVTMLGATYTVYNEPEAENNNSLEILGGTAVSTASKAGPPGIVVFGPFVEHDFADHATATPAQYQAAYLADVEEFLALTPPPKIYLMTPPPVGFVWGKGVTADFVTNVVDASVLAVAQAKGLTANVIDLYKDAYLATAPASDGGDGHFSIAGLAEVAKLAYAVIGGTPGTGGSGASTGTSSGATTGATSGATTGTGSGSSTGTTSGATTGVSGGASTGGSGVATGSPSGTGIDISGATTGVSTGIASGSTSGTGSGSTQGAGTGSASGETGGSVVGAAGTNPDTGGTNGTPKNSSGCTIGASGSTGAAAGLLSFFGLAVLVGSRKRGSQRR